MEQIKLITEHTINGLEREINKFMSTLDEHTDILDVYIDSEYADGPYVVLKNHLLAIIRYTVYKEEHISSKDLKDLLEEEWIILHKQNIKHY